MTGGAKHPQPLPNYRLPGWEASPLLLLLDCFQEGSLGDINAVFGGLVNVELSRIGLSAKPALRIIRPPKGYLVAHF